MSLSSCPRCERHVVVEATSCPFCGTRLGTVSHVGLAICVVALGVALSSCVSGGDDGLSDYSGADYAGPGEIDTNLPATESMSSSSSSGTSGEASSDTTGSGTGSSSGGTDTEGADTSGTSGTSGTDTTSGSSSGG